MSATPRAGRGSLGHVLIARGGLPTSQSAQWVISSYCHVTVTWPRGYVTAADSEDQDRAPPVCVRACACVRVLAFRGDNDTRRT